MGPHWAAWGQSHGRSPLRLIGFLSAGQIYVRFKRWGLGQLLQVTQEGTSEKLQREVATGRCGTRKQQAVGVASLQPRGQLLVTFPAWPSEFLSVSSP